MFFIINPSKQTKVFKKYDFETSKGQKSKLHPKQYEI